MVSFVARHGDTQPGLSPFPHVVKVQGHDRNGHPIIHAGMTLHLLSLDELYQRLSSSSKEPFVGDDGASHSSLYYAALVHFRQLVGSNVA